MPILDDDRFLIEDSGVSKKIRASVLKPELNGIYGGMKMLVNTSSYSSRWIYARDIQTNLTTGNWMMVERSGTSYRVSADDVQAYFPSGPAGASGVIQDAHPLPIDIDSTGSHSLTVEYLPDIALVDNESVRMVDQDGNTASYTPETDTISNVNQGGFSGTVTYRYPSDATVKPWDNRWDSAPSTEVVSTVGVRSGTYFACGAHLWRFAEPHRTSVYCRESSGTNVGLYKSDDGVNWVFDSQGWTHPKNNNGFQSTGSARYWQALMNYNHADGSHSAIAQDDMWALVAVDTVTLTFASPSSDLKFFQPGEVVQDVPSSVSYRDPASRTMIVSDGNWVGSDGSGCGIKGWRQDKIYSNDLTGYGGTPVPKSLSFDGDKTTMFHDNGNLLSQWCVWAPNPPISFSSEVRIYHEVRNDATNDQTELRFNNGDRGIFKDPGFQWVTLATGSGTINDIQISRNGYNYFASLVVVDGFILVDSNIPGPGPGDLRQTKVTGLPKSGIGKVNGSPSGNIINVRESNGQWIDETNRLGTKYYVKNGTGRVAIRRYAEQFGYAAAIAEAGDIPEVWSLLEGLEGT